MFPFFFLTTHPYCKSILVSEKEAILIVKKTTTKNLQNSQHHCINAPGPSLPKNLSLKILSLCVYKQDKSLDSIKVNKQKVEQRNKTGKTKQEKQTELNYISKQNHYFSNKTCSHFAEKGDRECTRHRSEVAMLQNTAWEYLCRTFKLILKWDGIGISLINNISIVKWINLNWPFLYQNEWLNCSEVTKVQKCGAALRFIQREKSNATFVLSCWSH